MNTENNKIVAKFMEARVTSDTFFITGMYMHISDQDLNYNSNWNWLMEVVEKIEDLGYTVNIKGISCTVTKLLEDTPIIAWVLGNRKQKIDLVYTVCVEFIKFHNSLS